MLLVKAGASRQPSLQQSSTDKCSTCRNFYEHEDIKDQDPSSRSDIEQQRTTPPLLNPNGFSCTPFENQFPDHYELTMEGVDTFDCQANDSHTPGFSFSLGS